MNRTAVKNYAVRARRDFQKIVTERANALGISAKDIAKAEPAGDMIVIKGRPFPKAIEMPRRELAGRVQRDGFDVVVEHIAYTLFNRFCALRFMEVNGYLSFPVFSSSSGDDTPDILKHAIEATEALSVSADKREQITDLKMRGDQDQKLYSMLLLAQCNALATAMPFLFERPNDVTELLMPENLLHSDSVVRDLVASIDDADWQEIEIVGWLYQFYISEKKDQVIGKVVKKEDIPAATQLFTPRWIVQYMVENSLGRLWLQSHPDSGLKARMPYYIENPDDAKLSPGEILTVDTPDEITCMDPCCGSGHILVYMFDLLYAMYEESGYIQRDIPRMILENNLHGIDIDERAAQLSGFALMMKARERDPKYLENAVQPHVMAIEESNGIDLQAEARIEGKEQRSPFEADGSLIPDEGLLPTQQAGGTGDDALRPFAPLVRFFEDAKNYGTLLRVPDSLTGRLEELALRIADLRGGGALFTIAAMPRLERLIRQAKMLNQEYYVVATNPPYMGTNGMNPPLKELARKAYPLARADLMTCFMDRAQTFVKSNGYWAMINMPSWMFLTTFSDLRKQLFSLQRIVSLLHLGRGIFGSDFGSLAFIVQNASRGGIGVYHRLFEKHVQVRSVTKIRDMFLSQKEDGFFFHQEGFSRIPGYALAYWLSPMALDVFRRSEPLRCEFDAKSGVMTGDDAFFLRQWFEVDHRRIGFGYEKESDIGPEHIFFPMNKEEGYRKWSGRFTTVFRYVDHGREHAERSDINYRLRDRSLYFRSGISWGDVTSGPLSFRYQTPGLIFAARAPMLFCDDKVLLGFLNSKLTLFFGSAINPTLSFNLADLYELPLLKDALHSVSSRIEANVDELLRITDDDWNATETSWNFTTHPLLKKGVKDDRVLAAWENAERGLVSAVDRVQNLETENNRILIDAYGLESELKPDVTSKEISLSAPDLKGNVLSLISYAVGCMMGRYSPDTLGLQFAGGAYDHDKACEAAPSFHPDADGILPVLADAYFEDDVTSRFAVFLKATFGKEHLSENLRFVAEAIGIKGSESSQDAIRRFLANDFFKYHMKMYKKRPIYWLFSSGKEKAFQALVYLHRYTPATLARMRTGYLHELQNKMRARIQGMDDGKDAATSTAQANRINRDLTKLRKQLEELRVYDEKLHHYADQRIEIDLDDGVKHNYGLFGDLLAEVKAITGEKA